MTTNQSADVEMLRKVKEYLTQHLTFIAEFHFRVKYNKPIQLVKLNSVNMYRCIHKLA